MKTVVPEPPYNSGIMLLALCVWREARSESYAGKLGVVWVLRNRSAMAPLEGFRHSIDEEILRPWQFSSFNENDPNSTKYPEENEPSWLDCLKAAQSDEPDPTGGAVFYFSRPLKEPPKAWGNVIPTADIGNLHFCAIGQVT